MAIMITPVAIEVVVADRLKRMAVLHNAAGRDKLATSKP
jgi:hypothetical protein